MSKRRRLLIASGLVGILGLVALAVPGRLRADRWALSQIGNGATEREVQFIVGRPPGDYSGGRPLDGQAAQTLRSMRSLAAGQVAGYGPGSVVREWGDSDGVLLVGFDPAGGVCFKHLVERDGVYTASTPPVGRSCALWVGRQLGWLTPAPPPPGPTP